MISPNGQAFEKDALGPQVTFRKRAWKLGHKADILATLSSPPEAHAPKLPESPREIRLAWPRMRQNDLASFQNMQMPRFGVKPGTCIL